MYLTVHVTILISLFLILLCAIFSLFDSALGLCRKSRLEKERGKRYKAVLKVLENPRNLNIICCLWINILKTLTVLFVSLIFIKIISSSVNEIQNNSGMMVLILSILVLGIIITLIADALPKLFSRIKPEKIAAALLPLIRILSVPMIPFALAAVKSASFFNKKFHPEIDDENITEEELQDELRNTLIEGEKSGIVESKERDMVEGVFYLGDRPVGAFMTHRSEIQWLDINDPYDEICAKALEYRQQQCFPVVNGSPDEITGAVFLEDIILDQSQNEPKGLRVIMKKALFVPETMPAIKAFESFRQGQSNFLFVMDEYGGLAGIISIRALVEEIVGELSSTAAAKEPLLQQEDGTWIADGTLNIDDAAKALDLAGIGEEGDFHTLAGLILQLAGELPSAGDSYEYQGYTFKVTGMDGNRIDKLLISRINE